MFTKKYENYLVLTKEKSTSKIVAAINEVLRVRMLILTPTHIVIMTHPSSNYKLLHLRSVKACAIFMPFLRRNSTKCKFSEG